MLAFDLKGKTALVTGGAKRLGEAISYALAQSGAHIILHYNSSEKEVKALADRLNSPGATCRIVCGDLSKPEAPAEIFGEACAVSGPIDILVNNASVFEEDSLLEFSYNDLFRNITVNSLAPLALARSFALQKHSGAIVNILDSRITDYDSKHASYHLSKRMLSDITRMLAIELAPAVRVNGVAPGLILPPAGKDDSYLEERKNTNLLGAHGEAADIADAVLYLIRSTFVTGQVIYVDGGRHLKGRVYED
jgi:pteridine reductase